jgi:hypothetical protein
MTTLPVQRRKRWSAEDAFARLRAHFNDDVEGLKCAFLHVEDSSADPDQWPLELLVGDVDDDGTVFANSVAVHKAAAALYGAGSALASTDAGIEIKSRVDSYYAALDLSPPADSFGMAEFLALSHVERESRLRGMGLSQKLAKLLLSSIGETDAKTRKVAEREAIRVLKTFTDTVKTMTGSVP